MKTLEILSLFWKAGAKMELLPNGEIKLTDHNRVPAEIMKSAEQVFPDIEKWFISWKNANSTQLTLWKAYQQYCNWGTNQNILDWLNKDEHAAYFMNDWMIELGKNGWVDMYEDYRPFENEKSNEIAERIFKNAVEFMKANKSVEGKL